ncbi:MAG: multicopper oxidase family protein [Planctomycetota bacterium]|nr:MAG: multicopper oxidase family protein [Planctomycetota bacterium]
MMFERMGKNWGTVSRVRRGGSGRRSARAPLAVESLEGRQLLATIPMHAMPQVHTSNSHVKTIPGTGGKFITGQPLKEPTQYFSKDGELNVTLHVQQKVVNVSGRRVFAMIYNNSFDGPTLHLKPGDTLKISLVNDLPTQVTDLHFHGLHVSPEGNSDNIFLEIPAGTTFDYVVHIPLDQVSGTYWYHSHAHPNSEGQVFNGLSGLLEIEGLKQLLPLNLQGVKEVTMALKDLQVMPNGAIPYTNINSGAPTTRTINSQVQPKVSIAPGETQLWHIANIGADIYYKLAMGGRKFTIIAEDGYPVWNVTSATTLLMPPGKRFDVLVQGPPKGVSYLVTKPYSTGPWGDQYPGVVMATIVSKGTPQTPLPMPTAGLVPKSDLSTAKIDASRTFVFSENPNTNQFYINGVQYDPNVVNVTVPLGSTEEWTIVNAAQEQHPFHIHINDYQVMSINGAPYQANSLQDTINLPYGGYVVIRQKFTQFKGKFVFHCHILGHEDNGMMQVVEVV